MFNDEKRMKCYQPALDINQLSVNLLFNKIESFGSEHFLTDKNEILDKFWHKTLSMKQKSEDLSENILVKDI